MTFEQYLRENEENNQFIDGATAGFIAAYKWLKDEGTLKDKPFISGYINIKDKKFLDEFNKQRSDISRIVDDLLNNNDDVVNGLKKFNEKDRMYALHMIENGIKKDLTKEDYEVLLKLSDLVIREMNGEIIKSSSGIESEPTTSGPRIMPIQATYVNTL
ncbi:MAG: hypothetical protein WC755_09145 [Candidatus Woesearchaeota archaeon]|jgi:hypothetical protein